MTILIVHLVFSAIGFLLFMLRDDVLEVFNDIRKLCYKNTLNFLLTPLIIFLILPITIPINLYWLFKDR